MSKVVACRYTHTIKGRNYDKVYNRRMLKEQLKRDHDCQLETTLDENGYLTDEWVEVWNQFHIDDLNLLNRIILEELSNDE